MSRKRPTQRNAGRVPGIVLLVLALVLSANANHGTGAAIAEPPQPTPNEAERIEAIGEPIRAGIERERNRQELADWLRRMGAQQRVELRIELGSWELAGLLLGLWALSRLRWATRDWYYARREGRADKAQGTAHTTADQPGER